MHWQTHAVSGSVASSVAGTCIIRVSSIFLTRSQQTDGQKWYWLICVSLLS
jgi:hypothetical protein